MKKEDPIIQLFLTDLKSQVKSLNVWINNLRLQKDQEKAFEGILKTLGMIRGAAHIIGYLQVENICKTLESFFREYRVMHLSIPSENFPLLLNFISIFEEISKCSEESIPQFFFEHEVESNRLIQQLASSKIKPEESVDSSSLMQNETSSSEFNASLPDTGMLDLFKIELEVQSKILNDGLVKLEQGIRTFGDLEVLMRAVHSIKGASRIVLLEQVEHLAHTMEDCFVALMNNKIGLDKLRIDLIFNAVDLFVQLSHVPNHGLAGWIKQETPQIESLVREISSMISGQAIEMLPKEDYLLKTVTSSQFLGPKEPKLQSQERILRVSAENLNRLMGLAGESLVESRWLHPFSESLIKLKKMQNELIYNFDILRDSLTECVVSEKSNQQLLDLQHLSSQYYHSLSDRIVELEMFITRHSNLSDRLYSEVIESHMRPFNDCVEAFPRMVRDVSKELNKKVKLEIAGRATPVDRDILQRLESPLNHLVRNAIDHGIEAPDVRIALGKPAEGMISIDARHRGGMLSITISDDGAGVDIEKLRHSLVEKKLVKQEIASKLQENEILDFLFLPGFSTAEKVTEISGRGMGLNIVQNLIQEVGGLIRVKNFPGKGLEINLQLPLTLSVIHALVVEINGESFAFPLAHIERTVLVSMNEIHVIENRQYFHFEGKNVGLVPACKVLELGEYTSHKAFFPVIIVSDRENSYGLAVDEFIGEKELVVHELDSRLGKIPNISAGSLMENGEPLLIIDVEDIIRSTDLLLSGGRLYALSPTPEEKSEEMLKKILVVDDSITVREVECRLLRSQGYSVEMAVNGMDAWNAVRMGNYDLLITDVDMPRMNGIELVRLIKKDPRLKDMPIMIVSYKEHEGDRLLGLEAGANYYLTKSSFHDETLLNAVEDLIGKP